MMNINKEYAAKLSTKLENGKAITSKQIMDTKLTHLEAYELYADNVSDIRTIEILQNFMVFVSEEEYVEQVNNAITYIVSKNRSKKNSNELSINTLCAIITYLVGAKERGINTKLVTSGRDFFVDGETVEAGVEAYRSVESIAKLTEQYDYRHITSYVYEGLSENAGQLTELRLGKFSAMYLIRKMMENYYPERVTEMYVAGKTVHQYDIPDFGIKPCTDSAKARKSKVSSSFRELLDNSFDYEFLKDMEEAATKFNYRGEQLKGDFFFDYRGRMYWDGNINPQGDTEARHLSVGTEGTLEYDATCSGIQIGSILSNNVEMMKKTNVINVDGTKQDAYQYIADKAAHSLGMESGEIDRKVAKKAVMLTPYGAAAQTLIGHSVEEAKKAGFEEPKVIGKAVYNSVKENIDRDATYKRVLEEIEIKVFSKNGIDYGEYASWTTPDGLNVNSYSKLPVDKVNKLVAEGADVLHTYRHADITIETNVGDIRIDQLYMDGVNIKFYNNSTPNVGQVVPNFVHSLDATALRFVCKKLLAKGIPVFPVHDCVILPEHVTQEEITDLFQQAYQYIADFYNVDVKVDGLVVFPED